MARNGRRGIAWSYTSVHSGTCGPMMLPHRWCPWFAGDLRCCPKWSATHQPLCRLHNFQRLGAKVATWFTVAKKTTGPIFVPCGTQHVVLDHSDRVSWCFTHCCRPERKSPILVNSSGRTCIVRSLCIATLTSTLSKALL